jgi:hypothetical protein
VAPLSSHRRRRLHHFTHSLHLIAPLLWRYTSLFSRHFGRRASPAAAALCCRSSYRLLVHNLPLLLRRHRSPPQPLPSIP